MPEYEITLNKPIAKGIKTALTTYLGTNGHRDINYRPNNDGLSACFTTKEPLDETVFDFLLNKARNITGLNKLE